ncbi:voltage-gated chloride channel [Haemophilus parainfluenzae]|jgi:raw score 1.17|nr:voltage-gated chloride channel [Haemophilus parainfluenzae]
MGNIIFECFFRLFFEGLFEFLFNKYPKLSWRLWCAFSLLFGLYFFTFLNIDKSTWIICLLAIISGGLTMLISIAFVFLIEKLILREK